MKSSTTKMTHLEYVPFKPLATAVRMRGTRKAAGVSGCSASKLKACFGTSCKSVTYFTPIQAAPQYPALGLSAEVRFFLSL